MSRTPGRLRRLAAVFAVATSGAVLLAPAASADHYLGSTLAASATISQAFQQDTTFWATAIPVTAPPGALAPPGNPAVVPEDGQILQFQLRGFAGGGLGSQPIFFQDLRRAGGGKLKVIATSQAFSLPGSDGMWSFDPTNFCVKTGDVLGFSDLGGFEQLPNGVPFQVFGSVQGAQTEHYTKDNGVKNGATLSPTALPPNVELLMAAYEGTGGHASPLCGGVNGIEASLPQGSATVGTNGTVTLAIGCTGPFPCIGQAALQLPTGTAAVKHRKKKKRQPSNVLGAVHFSIPRHHTSQVKIHLSKRGRKLLRQHHHRLAVKLVVRLGAGTAADTSTSSLTLKG